MSSNGDSILAMSTSALRCREIMVLTIIFVILINEVFAKELDELNDKEEKKGGSFNKKELDKAINTLKTVQKNM